MSTLGLDVEVYPNFFVACFIRFDDGKKAAFELSDRCPLDSDKLKKTLSGNTIVTFNGNTYDLPIVALALKGATNAELKRASDRIVNTNSRGYEVLRELNVNLPQCDHVDLMEPNPSIRQSLKMLAGRLHAKHLVDLPFPPDTILTPRQMNEATLYCFNDIDALALLREAMRPALELRAKLGKVYKQDFRSKSDAQIGEAIVLSKFPRQRPPAPKPMTFRYELPSWVSFHSDKLKLIASRLAESEFHADEGGKITMPSWLDGLPITIGSSTYAMGVGGLHSQEEHRAVLSDADNQLVDVDVSSHYPKIIVNQGLYPAALGPSFTDVARNIVEERLAAKASYLATGNADDKIKMEGLKIAANGALFGKLGSSYSAMYAPHLLTAVTITGQLSLLMLIDAAEHAGIPVVSANTDGIVLRVPKTHADAFHQIIKSWEEATGFETEHTPYRALYSSSVNSYMAIKEDGKVKRKGPFADPWAENDARGMMSKNPQMTIVAQAVADYLAHGTPIEQTIRAETDPRRFLTLIRVKEGGVWRGNKLGRACRYYWSQDGDPITYADSGRQVAKTQGARPMMTLPDTLPTDVDYPRYIKEAEKTVVDYGGGLM